MQMWNSVLAPLYSSDFRGPMESVSKLFRNSHTYMVFLNRGKFELKDPLNPHGLIVYSLKIPCAEPVLRWSHRRAEEVNFPNTINGRINNFRRMSSYPICSWEEAFCGEWGIMERYVCYPMNRYSG
jgi:hypothetical protein